jgi:hypothetical protein
MATLYPLARRVATLAASIAASRLVRAAMRSMCDKAVAPRGCDVMVMLLRLATREWQHGTWLCV